MAEYTEYLVSRTFDVMDMFDELDDKDKKYFIVEAIRGLDYGDDFDAVNGAVVMLDDCQHQKIIKEAFDTISSDDDRLSLVCQLAEKLTMEQREELKRELDK